MKTKLLLFLIPLLVACGSTNQFAKRKYTKGVYVGNRTQAKTKNSTTKKGRFKVKHEKGKKNEVASNHNNVIPNQNTAIEPAYKDDIEMNPKEIISRDFIESNKSVEPKQNEESNLYYTNAKYEISIVEEEEKNDKNFKKNQNGTVASVVLGVLSLVIAIVARFTGYFAFIITPFAMILGLLAIILGGIRLAKKESLTDKQRKMAIAGLLLGIAGLIAAIVVLVIILGFL